MPLPSFRDGLRRAQVALSDDVRIAALAADDRVFLRAAFADLLIRLDGHSFCGARTPRRPGHRQLPHDSLRTAMDRLRECLSGPLEWDLAFLSDDVRASFKDVDAQLLELLITLKSALHRHMVLGPGSIP